MVDFPLYTGKSDQTPRSRAAAGTPASPTQPQFARLAPKPTQELRSPLGQRAQQLTHLSQPRPQLGVTHLDRQHRVLEVGEDVVGLADGVGRGLDELPHAARRAPGPVASKLRPSNP